MIGVSEVFFMWLLPICVQNHRGSNWPPASMVEAVAHFTLDKSLLRAEISSGLFLLSNSIP